MHPELRSKEPDEDERHWWSVEDRLAALTVRRICNQHKCSPADGPCDDPQHRQDVDFLKSMLTMLELPGRVLNVTNEERERWPDPPSRVGGSEVSCFDRKKNKKAE
jgi:hypothetical protein